jgi:hypothetical protein
MCSEMQGAIAGQAPAGTASRTRSLRQTAAAPTCSLDQGPVAPSRGLAGGAAVPLHLLQVERFGLARPSRRRLPPLCSGCGRVRVRGAARQAGAQVSGATQLGHARDCAAAGQLVGSLAAVAACCWAHTTHGVAATQQAASRRALHAAPQRSRASKAPSSPPPLPASPFFARLLPPGCSTSPVRLRTCTIDFFLMSIMAGGAAFGATAGGAGLLLQLPLAPAGAAGGGSGGGGGGASGSAPSPVAAGGAASGACCAALPPVQRCAFELAILGSPGRLASRDRQHSAHIKYRVLTQNGIHVPPFLLLGAAAAGVCCCSPAALAGGGGGGGGGGAAATSLAAAGSDSAVA